MSLLLTETNTNDQKTTDDPENTMVGPLWGQFVTHDIIQTPDMGNGEEIQCDCSRMPKCKNIFVNRIGSKNKIKAGHNFLTMTSLTPGLAGGLCEDHRQFN